MAVSRARNAYLLLMGFRGQALAVDQIMWTKCAEDALNLVEKGDREA